MPILRREVTQLRITLAQVLDRPFAALAWALDAWEQIQEEQGTKELSQYELATQAGALVTLAVCASRVNFLETSRLLYAQAAEVAPLNRPFLRGVIIARQATQLFNQDRTPEALDGYVAALNVFESSTAGDSPTWAYEIARVQAYRADCLERLSEPAQALAAISEALQAVEQGRQLAVYQAARTADTGAEDALRLVLRILSRLGSYDYSSTEIVRTFLRFANSSVASVIRGAPTQARRSGIYVAPGDPHSLAVTAFSAAWAPITETDVTRVAHPIEPTLLVMPANEVGTAGLTVLIQEGHKPVTTAWDVSESSVEPFMRTLLTGGGTLTDGGRTDAWLASAGDPRLKQLAQALLPRQMLEERFKAESVALRICPLGPLWRFPWGALPGADGNPIVASHPLILTTADAHNVTSAAGNAWLGHFDLSLSYALRDQKTVYQQASRVGARLRLIGAGEVLPDEPSEPVSLVVFAGHGVGTGAAQRLRLAGGQTLRVEDLPNLSRGAIVVLNACWVGAVLDDVAVEPSDLALALLARGAHSVIGTIRAVQDVEAAAYLQELLPRLVDGLDPARAVLETTRAILHDRPEAPLHAWASHTLIARATHFEPNRSNDDTHRHNA
ncbi:CHAT domain-containing protein [Aquipuribacter sp. MA13-6]|uniref:CHAT domain-containing protein n=1 Tax=unclassified Aquipuribacter TaxID=2635084 RepID=UPI003EE82201